MCWTYQLTAELCIGHINWQLNYMLDINWQLNYVLDIWLFVFSKQCEGGTLVLKHILGGMCYEI